MNIPQFIHSPLNIILNTVIQLISLYMYLYSRVPLRFIQRSQISGLYQYAFPETVKMSFHFLTSSPECNIVNCNFCEIFLLLHCKVCWESLILNVKGFSDFFNILCRQSYVPFLLPSIYV